MFVRQTIEIRPNNKQKTYFRQCFGAHRLAYNYGIKEWVRLRDSGQKTNLRDIRTAFNALKQTHYSFLYKLSSSATTFAFDDLKRAFENFFKGGNKIKNGSKDDVSGFPQIKGKSYYSGCYTEYFSLHGDGGPVIVDHRVVAKNAKRENGTYNTKYVDVNNKRGANKRKPYLRLPRIGTVRMTRLLRYQGRPVSVTIRQHNERFYACFLVEVTEQEFYRRHPRYKTKPTAAVGIDLGTKELAVTSDGIAIENPRHWERQLEHENRLQERMNHCRKSSNSRPGKNFLKAKMKLWRHRTKIRNQREDYRNKFCAAILATYQHIGIETLDVKSMGETLGTKKGKKTMRKRLNDVSLYEIRHRLETLGEVIGRNVVAAPRSFPSTRRCCQCGHVEPPISIKQRTYHCPKCGNTIDRDLNAAINLRKITGRGTSSSMPQAADRLSSDLMKSNILHWQIGEGK